MRFVKLGLCGVLSLLVLQSTASAQLLKKLEQRLNEGGIRIGPLDAGAPTPAATPGYLGLTADETDGRSGVVVLGVKPNSPAEAAGLQKDDVISVINNSAVRDLNDFQERLDLLPAGQTAQFTVHRGNSTQLIRATLVARQTPPVNRGGAEDPGPPPGTEDPLEIPGTPRAESGSVLRSSEETTGRASLGVSVVPLTEQARVANGLQVTRGAMIAAVRPGGPADRAGIPVGGVIVAIDGQRVNSAEELVAIIAASRPGQEVEVSYYRGATLARRTIRLSPVALDARGTPVPSATQSTPPAIGGLLGGPVGDRPLARRVGEVLDNLARPAGGPPAGQMEDIASLRDQVQQLQATVRSLEDRLQKLEAKTPTAAPAAEVTPDLNPAVRGPELPLPPPVRPALPTPPALP